MYNKVIIIGHLTRDVELRYLPSGSALSTLGLASNRRYKKQDGSKAEEVCFVDVKLFGRAAEVANQYLAKGSKVLIEGRLNFETWTDEKGQKRSRHTVIAESMQMLDSKSDSNDSNNASMPDGVVPPQVTPNQQAQAPQGVASNAVAGSTSNNGVPNQGGNAGNSNYPNSVPLIEISEDEIPF